MKKQNKLLVAAVLMVITASSFMVKLEASGLKISVSGIRNTEGYIHVFLFNKATGYPVNHEMAFKHVKSKPSAGELTISVEIPNGTYSIVAFHDKNGNEKFDKSWLGSPKEDYGFSNIPGEFCGTPSFEQTSFAYNQPGTAIRVKLLNSK